MDQIFEVFSDSIAMLVTFALDQQDKNVEPSEQFCSAVQVVQTHVSTLSTVARQMLNTYKKYPDLYNALEAAAEGLDNGSVLAGKSLITLKEPAKRKQGWDDNVQGCKQIALFTVKLLEVAKEVPRKRVRIEADLCRAAMEKLKSRVSGELQDLFDAANPGSQAIADLASAVSYLSKEEGMDSEQAEQLVEDFDNLVSSNHKMIDSVNEVLKTQGLVDANKEACLQMLNKICRLIDTIVNEIDEVGSEFDSFEKNMERQIAAALEARRKRMAMADEALRQHELRLRARQIIMDADKEGAKSDKLNKLSESCKKLHDTKAAIKEAVEQGKLQTVSDLLNGTNADVPALADAFRDAVNEEIERLSHSTKKMISDITKSNKDMVDAVNHVLQKPHDASRGEAVLSQCKILDRAIINASCDILSSKGRPFDGLDTEFAEDISVCRGKAESAMVNTININENISSKSVRASALADTTTDTTKGAVAFAEAARDLAQKKINRLQGFSNDVFGKLKIAHPNLLCKGNAFINKPGPANNEEFDGALNQFDDVVAKIEENSEPHKLIGLSIPNAVFLGVQDLKDSADVTRPSKIDARAKLFESVENASMILAEVNVKADRFNNSKLESMSVADATRDAANVCESISKATKMLADCSERIANEAMSLAQDDEKDLERHAQLLKQYEDINEVNRKLVAAGNALLIHPKDAKARPKVIDVAADGQKSLLGILDAANKDSIKLLPEQDSGEGRSEKQLMDERAAREKIVLDAVAKETMALREALQKCRDAKTPEELSAAQALATARLLRLEAVIAQAKQELGPRGLQKAMDKLKATLDEYHKIIASGLGCNILTPLIASDVDSKLAANLKYMDTARDHINEVRDRRMAGDTELLSDYEEEEAKQARKKEEERLKREAAVAATKREQEEIAMKQKLLEDERKKQEAERAALLEVERKRKVEEERIRKEKEEEEREEALVVPAKDASTDEKLQYHSDIVAKAVSKNKEIHKDEVHILEVSNDVSDNMALLAEAFRLKDRSLLLKAAKAIVEKCKTMSAESELAVKDCADPVLKKQVTGGVTTMRNLAVQLKIVAAVKATSIELDAVDDDSQLLGCCEGISKAMTTTVNGVHSAKLRTKFQTTVTTALVVNKFFKKTRSKALLRKSQENLVPTK